jgi:hypothetical protein
MAGKRLRHRPSARHLFTLSTGRPAARVLNPSEHVRLRCRTEEEAGSSLQAADLNLEDTHGDWNSERVPSGDWTPSCRQRFARPDLGDLCSGRAALTAGSYAIIGRDLRSAGLHIARRSNREPWILLRV